MKITRGQLRRLIRESVESDSGLKGANRLKGFTREQFKYHVAWCKVKAAELPIDRLKEMAASGLGDEQAEQADEIARTFGYRGSFSNDMLLAPIIFWGLFEAPEAMMPQKTLVFSMLLGDAKFSIKSRDDDPDSRDGEVPQRVNAPLVKIYEEAILAGHVEFMADLATMWKCEFIYDPHMRFLGKSDPLTPDEYRRLAPGLKGPLFH